MNHTWRSAQCAVLFASAAAACSAADAPGDLDQPGPANDPHAAGGSGGALVLDGGKSSKGDGSTHADGGKSCDSVQVPSDAKTVVQPGNVLVLFNRSNSMGESFDTPNGCAPKYQAAGDALIDAISPIATELTVGALLFPTTSKSMLCTAVVDPITAPTQIDFRPGGDFIQAWHAWWQANGLILGTPLNRAFDQADQALQSASLQGRTAVVVFTDGEPVCTDGTPAPDRAAAWLASGIKTWVVGLPGADGSQLLNDIAVNGGTGGYLLPADSAQLQTQLSDIAETTVSTTIASCTIHLNPLPPDSKDVHLVVVEAATSVEYEVALTDANGDGWEISTDGSIAMLVGKTCKDAKQGRFSSIRFEYGCVDLPPMPK